VWPQVSLDANAFLVGILARHAAKQPLAAGAAAIPQAAVAMPVALPAAPTVPPPALVVSLAKSAAVAATLPPTLGAVSSASAAAQPTYTCAARVRVSPSWTSGIKAAPYAATVSLTVTNAAAAAASLKITLSPPKGGAYADAGSGQAWGWDSLSVVGGVVQGNIGQVRGSAHASSSARARSMIRMHGSCG